MDLAHDLTHAWRVVEGQNGTDLTLRLAPYLVSIRAVDRAGQNADEVSLTLDAGKRLRLPNLSKSLRIYMGESRSSLRDLGVYYVNDYVVSGPPDTLEVVARPMYFGGGADPFEDWRIEVGTSDDNWNGPTRVDATKNRTFELTTLGQVAQQIGDELGFAVAVDPDFSVVPIDFAEQRNENDVVFLQRLANDAGGVAKVAAGNLFVGTSHTSQSAIARKGLPRVKLTPEDVASYQGSWSARDEPGAVRATWYDPLVGLGGSETFGDGEPVIDMIRQFPNAAAAQRGAFARHQLRKHARRQCSLTLASLNLDVWVGSQVELGGRWHEAIRGTWAVLEAEHEITAAGGETTLTMEIRA